jgi:hypothetical protein
VSNDDRLKVIQHSLNCYGNCLNEPDFNFNKFKLVVLTQSSNGVSAKKHH